MIFAVLISGSGGQGALLAGKILAEAALSERMNVSWFPSYGAAMRGGTSNCTVVISDRTIGSPIVSIVDVLITLNELSLNSFEGMLSPGGLLVIDSSNIKARPGREDIKILEVPVKELASELKLGKPANVILLGAFFGSVPFIGPDTIADAMTRMGISDLESNIKAFNLGKEFCRN